MQKTRAGRQIRLKSWLQKVVLLTISILVSALLAEGAVRMYFGFMSTTTTWDGETTLEGRVAKYDPLLGYRLLPNSHAQHRGPEFDTSIDINAQGFRMDRDVAYEKSTANRRILLIGNSFAFGHGVNIEDRVSERLEEALSSVEVLNMGVWGTGTDQQYLLYREDGIKFNADLVILVYLIENIMRNGNDATPQPGGLMLPKPKFILENDTLVLTNVPVPKDLIPISEEQRAWQEQQGIGIPIPFKGFLREHSALYKFVRSRGSNVLHQLLGANPVPFPQYQKDHEAWRVTASLFKQFAKEAAHNDSEFLLVIVPTQEFVNRSHVDDLPQKMIVDTCKENRIQVFDILPGLRQASRESGINLYYPMDGHWNVGGHKAAARLIANHLIERLGYQ